MKKKKIMKERQQEGRKEEGETNKVRRVGKKEKK